MTKSTVHDVAEWLARLAPPALAEEWDNVGLLIGERQSPVNRVMTCLTLTDDVATEAIDRKADLIVTHHPFPFRPLERVTTDTPEGHLVWRLARAGLAVYSPHTAFDSAVEGINAQLAAGLNLAEPQPLIAAEHPGMTAAGAGRCGPVLEPTDLARLARNAGEFLKLDDVRIVGDPTQSVARVAVACGSGGMLFDAALDAGADAVVTGEATFHNLLAARTAGAAVVLVGHYASERFAVEWLANWLHDQTRLDCWASTIETDPITRVAMG